MSNRDYSYRRHKRFVKGIKRIKQDRAEHGNPYQAPQFDGIICECFSEDAEHGKGATFARFADYPKNCSCEMCRNYYWPYHKFVPTKETEMKDGDGMTY